MKALFGWVAVACGGLGWLAGSAQAADVSVTPAPGSGFVVQGAQGEGLRVQADGSVRLPALASAQPQALCVGAGGQLAPCSGGGGGGGSLPVGIANQTLRYNGSNSLVANPNLLAMQDGSLAAGLQAVASGGGSIALGEKVQATQLHSIAIGNGSVASGIGAVALGPLATAGGTGALAWGSSANATALGALALGSNATAGGRNSVAIGTDVSSTGNGSIVLGANAVSDADNSFVWNGNPNLRAWGPCYLGKCPYFNGFGPGDFYVTSPSSILFTVDPTNSYCVMNGATAGWSCSSDQNLKADIVPVDSQSVLDRLVAMPIATWMFKHEQEGSTHMGPMAQDFMAAFQLGRDDKTIGSTDAQGVAFAAIQGLNAKLEKALAGLRESNAQKDAEIARLHLRLAGLESLSSDVAALKLELVRLQAPNGAVQLYSTAR